MSVHVTLLILRIAVLSVWVVAAWVRAVGTTTMTARITVIATIPIRATIIAAYRGGVAAATGLPVVVAK